VEEHAQQQEQDVEEEEEEAAEEEVEAVEEEEVVVVVVAVAAKPHYNADIHPLYCIKLFILYKRTIWRIRYCISDERRCFFLVTSGMEEGA
jgi:hypothetical protein